MNSHDRLVELANETYDALPGLALTFLEAAQRFGLELTKPNCNITARLCAIRRQLRFNIVNPVISLMRFDFSLGI